MTRRRTSPALRCCQLLGVWLALAVAGFAVTAVAHLVLGGAW